MIASIEVRQPAPLENLSDKELRANINSVLEGRQPDFVVAATVGNAFSRSTAYAREIGLSGGVNSTTMTFNYDNTSEQLTPTANPQPEDWESLGITPLHADGEEGDRMLSINEALIGA